ncbi:hypothetical protein OO013_19900 [Mangrovivirga sp. M17]|uniref:Phage protein n=1 Tax=Mangrovivirga halotolerans TaxID=2993936 RepID=A0ABT3RWJ7_9BACT|nr:hypothetical protein [Mangrovivirga halotolerans]MCX2746153.1 hypothetical protein [Mangrovivirga halotolerans]
MSKIQEIEDIFNIFHDGTIDDIVIQSDKIDLLIEIQYLAELIDKKFEFFNLKLTGVELIEYDAWTDNSYKLTNWREIFELGISIINTETDSSGNVVVHSNCFDAPNDLFEGGNLIIKCRDYELFDELKNPITIERLKELSTFYWNEKFEKK